MNSRWDVASKTRQQRPRDLRWKNASTTPDGTTAGGTFHGTWIAWREQAGAFRRDLPDAHRPLDLMKLAIVIQGGPERPPIPEDGQARVAGFGKTEPAMRSQGMLIPSSTATAQATS